MKEIHQPLPSARKNQLVTRKVDGELLVYDRKNDRAHCLNSTAAWVWAHCDGRTSIGKMARLLEDEMKVPVDTEIILFALDQLTKSSLLSEPYAIPARFPMSRRKLMRMGVAAAVAVPFISSITAPTAAQAATCLPIGANCMSDAACCSNNCIDNGRGGFQCA